MALVSTQVWGPLHQLWLSHIIDGAFSPAEQWDKQAKLPSFYLPTRFFPMAQTQTHAATVMEQTYCASK